MTKTETKFRLAPHNNQFHGVGRKGQSEKGERLESIGNGKAKLYIDGKFIAIIKES